MMLVAVPGVKRSEIITTIFSIISKISGNYVDI